MRRLHPTVATLSAGSLLIAGLALAAPAAFAPTAAHAATSDLLISEYIEGTSNNKAIEIYNGTGALVDLAAGGYDLQMFFNGSSSAGLTIALTGSVANGDVYVVAQSAAVAAILAQADQTNAAGWFNGDDAVVLRHGGAVIDSIGQVGNDPGTEWGTGLTSTADNTLRRLASICAGDTLTTDAFDPSVQWEGFATDTFGGLGSHTAGCDAPVVLTTSPADGATNVARDANISVTFSEDVTVADSWYSISCASSGVHSAVVSGGPAQYSLNPDNDFAANEQCTVTITGSLVAASDDPANTMAADETFSFTTVDQAVCGDPSTAIHDIQGSGAQSLLIGETHTIEGVVVADFQGPGQLSGYYVQAPDAASDADATTSEGIFVFNTSNAVAVGDAVRVTGQVTEFNSSGTFLTELTGVSRVLICGTGTTLPTPATVTLPVAVLSDWEAVEGMLVTVDQDLTVTETFTLARFGEVLLSAGGRLFTPTNVVEPGAPAIAQQDFNDRNSILLDDGNNQQNIDPTLHPQGGLSASNTLRSGYTVHDLTGVLEQRFGVYRVQPTGPVVFDATNPRPAPPADVGGTVKVAALNVLNYFNGDGLGGGFPTPRGAETQFELDRQTAKTVAAVLGLDADVIGLMELENDASPNSAIEDLVEALNAETAPGTYSFIDTGVIGTDQIKVGLLYRPAAVTPVGDWAILTSQVDPRFIDTKNRPSLAQTFEDVNGARFTVVVNHLKSKGSDCNDVNDPDTGDGQGNCNLTRTAAAEALVDWIASDPTGSGDTDFIVIGDLNSYAKEDPIDALTAGGLVDTIAQFVGDGAYSYVFDGQSGYLDHALATPGLVGQITGVTEWHINADEPIGLDYNVNFKSPNQVNTFYAPDAYRSSDHDPVVVGLDMMAFDFSGFEPPIRDGVNVVQAGRAIPVKFHVDAPAGVAALTSGPSVQQVDCDTGRPIGTPTEPDTVGSAGSGVGGSFHFNWKTAQAWAGTCQELTFVLGDGSVRTAEFLFR
jgi:predicted extracellular nuclease